MNIANNMITRFVFVALFVALISASAFITFPIGPVPITLQNLFTLLTGLVLGPVLGSSAVGLFLVAGIFGMPVFANNGSPMGIVRIFGPTGGYLLGYLLGAFFAGLIVGTPRPGQKLSVWRLVLAVVVGVFVVYVPGLLRLKSFLNIGWMQTLITGFFPFIIADMIKGIVAASVAPRLRRIAAELIARGTVE